MEIIEELSDEFEEMYSKEGYKLAASSSIYIPWYRCTVKCKCRYEQPMTELDIIICKCINRDINTIEDISFVLGLDEDIVYGLIKDLESIMILDYNDDNILLTTNGKEAFRKQEKTEYSDMEFDIYMNGITSEWKVEEIPLKREIPNQDMSITLQPSLTVKIDTIENNENLFIELQSKHNINVVSMKLLEYKNIEFYEELILFYKDSKNKIIFLIYNIQNKLRDLELGSTLLKKYEKRRLLEIMQVEKLIIQNEELINKYNKNLFGHKYYRNKDIRELFKNIFDLAEKSIFIVSPWIDNKNYVVTEELLNKMENALKKRNIQITIGYGYISKEKMNSKRHEYTISMNRDKMASDKDWQTELMANKFKERFKEYKNFSIFYIGTHEKILSYDDRYTLVGSYNLLSYDGGEKDKYKGYSFRFEGAALIDDVEFAQFVKETIQKD